MSEREPFEDEAIVLNASVPILLAAKRTRDEAIALVNACRLTEPERDVLKSALTKAIALYETAVKETNLAKRIPRAGIAHEALHAVKVVAGLLT